MTTKEAEELFLFQEKRAGRLVFDAKFQRVSSHKVTLQSLIEQAPEDGQIVLHDIEQIPSMRRFIDALMARRFYRITVRILKPEMILDPNSEQSFITLEALAKYTEKSKKTLPQGFGHRKISDDTREKMAADRARGDTYREISERYGVSLRTAYLHCKAASSIRKEREAAPQTQKEEEHRPYDYSLCDQLFMPHDSRIAIIFKEYIRRVRSELTKDTYRKDFGRFLCFLAENNHPMPQDPRDITMSHGLDYLDYLLSRYDHATVRKYHGCVRVFLKYCLDRGYVQINEFATIQTPPIDVSEIKTNDFSKDEVSSIIEMAQRIYKSCPDRVHKMIAHRNLVAVYLLSHCGMRSHALLGLKKQDIFRDSEGVNFLRLKSKGGGTYKIALDEKTYSVLFNYINAWMKDDPGEAYIIFKLETNHLVPITNATLNGVIKRFQRLANIKGKYSSHSFRASWATLAYGKIDAKEMQLRLGHKSIKSTMAYVKMKLGKMSRDTSFISSGELTTVIEEGA